ncbi:MAG: glycosyltransferase family A protein [Verrucomicrobiales bacterium]
MLLSPEGLPSAFVDVDRLSADERECLDVDAGYDSPVASKWDAGYAGFYRGLVATRENALDCEGSVTVADEYRFLRKYFSPWWGVFFLVARCAQLRNPIEEVSGYLQSREVERVDLWSKSCAPKCSIPHSVAPDHCPPVTVVIPTLNRYQYLEDALRDLERQTFRGFDVVVIDQSQPFREEFYAAFDLKLKVIRQEQPGLWRARNAAVSGSQAGAILLFDDDSRVDPDWIALHLDCIEKYGADISSGVSLSTVGDRVPESYRNYRQADQLDTGNALVNRAVFERIGLFDEQFEGQRMGDSEFGLRAFLAGYRIISSPDAKRIHLKVESGGLRQMGSWDAFRPKSLFAPRPVPSVLYLLRKYFGDSDAIKAICVSVPPSVVPYHLKANRLLRGAAYLGALALGPLLLIQSVRSWKAASKKLREGARIPTL